MDTTVQFKASDGAMIWQRRWLASLPKAIVVIVHGMAEHSGRYDHFAQFLQENQITVLAHDQRGHGQSGEYNHDLGHLPPKLGWHLLIDDLARVIYQVRRQFDCPLFLLGHSMGSFVCRRFVQQNQGMIDGLILSGTGGHPGKAAIVGRQLALFLSQTVGAKRPAKLLQKMTFAAFNRPFKPARTEVDWLTRDQSLVDSYVNDPYCGMMCTNGFYHELYDLSLSVNQPENDRFVSKDMPILLISGDHDPVGEMAVGVKQVYQNYRVHGINDVTLNLYTGGRHDILNEINRCEVYQDVLEWLQKYLDK